MVDVIESAGENMSGNCSMCDLIFKAKSTSPRLMLMISSVYDYVC